MDSSDTIKLTFRDLSQRQISFFRMKKFKTTKKRLFVDVEHNKCNVTFIL